MKRLIIGIMCVAIAVNCLAVEPRNDKWPLTSSNSNITDVPTLHDFVPLDTESINT